MTRCVIGGGGCCDASYRTIRCDAVRHKGPSADAVRQVTDTTRIMAIKKKSHLASCAKQGRRATVGRRGIQRKGCNVSDHCECGLSDDGRLCNYCAEQEFRKLHARCLEEQERTTIERATHYAVCPCADDCRCSEKQRGTLSNYQSATYIGFHVYCRCDQPDYTPIIERKTASGTVLALEGGICRLCDGAMPPRKDHAIKRFEPGDDVLVGPTYDSWVRNPETGALERGPAEEPERMSQEAYSRMRRLPKSIIVVPK